MHNQRVTYYVSALAREYYYDTAREYNYTREPRRITAARTVRNLQLGDYPRPNTWGLANLITALSNLTFNDTRDPDIIAFDEPRANASPPLPPFWYSAEAYRWQWRLALPPATRTNLLAISHHFNIQPFSQRARRVNDNSRISATLEAIGQGNLTPAEPIPTYEYLHPVHYDRNYPTLGGQPSFTPGYYLRGY